MFAHIYTCIYQTFILCLYSGAGREEQHQDLHPSTNAEKGISQECSVSDVYIFCKSENQQQKQEVPTGRFMLLICVWVRGVFIFQPVLIFFYIPYTILFIKKDDIFVMALIVFMIRSQL